MRRKSRNNFFITKNMVWHIIVGDPETWTKFNPMVDEKGLSLCNNGEKDDMI